jgi:4-hydroxybenzoate polyprenyltransferase
MTEASCCYHLASLHSLPLDASGSVPSLPLCVASDATLHLVAMWIVVVQCLSFLFVLYGFVWSGLIIFFLFFPPLFFWEINRQARKKKEEIGESY